MSLLSVFTIVNNCLVLIFGLFLSVHISGGYQTHRQKLYIFVSCPILLLTQGIVWMLGDESLVEFFYPLIIHLPLVLILTFLLKRELLVSFISVCTAYLCCQLPHWAELVLAEFSGSALIGELGYTVAILGFYAFLRISFVQNAHAVLTYSKQTLVLFGILPFLYYLFDYAATVYTDVLYIGFQTVYEFIPTVLAVFYVLFLTIYHAQTQKKTQAELQTSMLNAELKQSLSEMEALRSSAHQTAIYQHDMRHHLNMIDNLIHVGKFEQAQEYIASIRKNIDSVTPKSYCANDTINLLCSSFANRAERRNVNLIINARAIPKDLPFSDTEFCSLVSNALENAIHAASALSNDKWISFYCTVKLNKLLVEVKNPYLGEIMMRDGIPISTREGHGYGCHSINAITERNGGMCYFEEQDGIFILRVVLPLNDASIL